MELLTITEAAAFLKISPHTLYKYVESGSIQCGRLGPPPKNGRDTRPIRFTKNHLNNFIHHTSKNFNDTTRVMQSIFGGRNDTRRTNHGSNSAGNK